MADRSAFVEETESPYIRAEELQGLSVTLKISATDEDHYESEDGSVKRDRVVLLFEDKEKGCKLSNRALASKAGRETSGGKS